mgnify:CR=1 FL=1
MGWHMDGSDWVWMTLLMLTFWALVGLAIAAVIRNARSERGPTSDPAKSIDRAVETLDRRFAAGEIDVDEYRSRREALHESSR